MSYVESTLEDFIKQSFFGGAVGAAAGALASDPDKTLEGALYGGVAGTAANAATMGLRRSYADGYRHMHKWLGMPEGPAADALQKKMIYKIHAVKHHPGGLHKYVAPKVLLGVGGGLLAAHLLNDKGLLGSSDTALPRSPSALKDRALEFYKDNETEVNSLAALAALAAAGGAAYKGYQSRNPRKK